uniref:Uncharacterized protein n=1 Tax=Arundo donax TaxID=35708 RepID=A0A0A8YNN8_ARUDO
MVVVDDAVLACRVDLEDALP